MRDLEIKTPAADWSIWKEILISILEEKVGRLKFLKVFYFAPANTALDINVIFIQCDAVTRSIYLHFGTFNRLMIC